MLTFHVVTIVPLDPEEAILRQIIHLGYEPQDVRHIVLTYMHFDHCGGMPDFPSATVHVHRREYEAFRGRPHRWTDLAYVRRHIAHQPRFALYDHEDESWFGWPAIRLPFVPEMLLVPLFGHSRGHCGVAIHSESGWLLHAGDAAPVDFGDYVQGGLARAVVGPLTPQLREFKAAHPNIRMTTGHMWRGFFETGRS